MIQKEEFKGYLSEEHKKKFTITAGILGACALIAQFIFPFIIMLFMMPAMMFSQFDMMKSPDMEKAAFWKGKVWYVEKSMGPGQNNNSVLKKISPFDEDAEPEEVKELDSSSPYLLADNKRLWLISPGEVIIYEKGKFQRQSNADQLGDISKPLLLQGCPTLIESTINKTRLLQLKNGNWKEIKEFGSSFYSSSVKIVVLNNIPYTLREYGDTVYSIKGLPDTEFDKKSWKTIGTAEGDWYALSSEDQLLFFANSGKYGRGGKLIGRKMTDKGWKKFTTVNLKMADEISVLNTGQNKLIICSRGFPGSFRFTEVKNGKVTRTAKHGRSSPFPPMMIAMIFIPHIAQCLIPVILAFILTGLMKKHRQCRYSYAHHEIPYASLIKRALAQIVDALIVGFPFIIGALIFMRMFFDMEEMITGGNPPYFMFVAFGFMAIGFLWVFICLFIFSWLEGSYGQTPGKWVAGIKVLGMDMNACGFGRALIRNLLKFVDSFFNFIVGVMIVALTEHWQRVGDLAARTIVVDIRAD